MLFIHWAKRHNGFSAKRFRDFIVQWHWKNFSRFVPMLFFCKNFQILKQKFSVFWHEIFSSRSELLKTCSRQKLAEIFFSERLSKSSYHFFGITVRKGCRTAFYVSTSLLSEKLFFLERRLTLENLLTSAKRLSVFWKKVSAELSKLYSTCPEKTLGENFPGKLLVSFNFLILGQKNLKFRWKLFHSPSQLFIMCTRQQFEQKYVCGVNRIIIFFGVLVKSFLRGSAEYHSTCSQPFFELLINVW